MSKPPARTVSDSRRTLSSDALFHFTSAKENLLSILRNGFSLRYCAEDFSELGRRKAGTPRNLLAFPMVCFCDIRLSQVVHHMETYGNYAIGLTKEWGIDSKLAPVLYGHKNAPLVEDLPQVWKELEGNKAFMNHLGQLFFRLKPYESALGHRERRGPTRFYDEREWRFLPNDIMDLEILVDAGARDGAALARANAAIAGRKLTFALKDIRYVIVRSEREILPIINKLEVVKAEEYSPNQLRLLISRIICADHIRKDF